MAAASERSSRQGRGLHRLNPENAPGLVPFDPDCRVCLECVMRRLLSVSLIVLAGAMLAVPAHAANQAVAVADNSFTPERVAVKPGESVNWTASFTGNPHNVAFEDGTLVQPSPPRTGPWTAMRTFPTPGAFPGIYRYYCQVHGAPGGIGMSGTVYVTASGALPPLASISVAPNPAQVGQSVNLSGAGSSGAGAIAKYEWDLDGDGSFELDGGTTPTTSRSYMSPATISVKLRVTDGNGDTDVATRALKINAAPTASFTVSPNPAQAGQTVSFDASASSDPDGSNPVYEWDLDGNGSFETKTFNTPTASRSYPSAATVAVKLRVTDSDGGTDETTRSLQVNAAQSPPPPSARKQQPAPQPKSSAKGKSGKCSNLKGKKRAACIRKRCRKLKRAKRRACVKKVTRKR